MRFSNTAALLSLAATLALAGWSPAGLQAQDAEASSAEGNVVIELIDQDGETVTQPKRVLARVRRQEGDEEGQKKSATWKVENKDGKVIIVDSEGNRRELKLDGAQSIVINKSAQTVDKDGKQETKVTGRAVIVGPDGKKQIIELGDGDVDLGFGQWDMAGPEGASVFRLNRNDNPYMIGVFCEPVSEALAAQLRLASGTGLVVANLTPESPAAEAGIEKHDILLFAEESELNDQKALIEAVQKAGKEEKPLSLTLLRAGKEISVEVTPTERPAGLLGNQMIFEPNIRVLPKLDGKFEFKFDDMGPGILIDRQLDEDMRQSIEEQMKAMQEQAAQMQKQMEELRQQMQRQRDNDRDK